MGEGVVLTESSSQVRKESHLPGTHPLDEAVVGPWILGHKIMRAILHVPQYSSTSLWVVEAVGYVSLSVGQFTID